MGGKRVMWGPDPASGTHRLAFLILVAVGAFIAVRVCELLEPPRLWPGDEHDEADEEVFDVLG